ncbi:dihydrolipoamide acetyltransferase family protein [Nocardia flavorosea]|uniref:Dihydrolipoamide acetyltransferase component of pyruvate dehydrogenase complex n=1 Tax=Nocardia flavorosea TaxID=53429 RepID=A0A846YDJ3_9NOCA|nr:dihydrolipoamide acetyltransferase family protein [Nocardia flavorosea]NKY56725.1 2-oxo acid dehydrogenase subunit E2 [Nocardia flavorosea]
MDDAATAESGEILEFRLPDLGEGLTDAELQNWTVEVGDEVELNQTIAEVETAKAVVALPSPFAGTVVELLAEPGATIEVGAPLLRIRSSTPAPGGNGRTSVLVGYGPEAENQPSRRRRMRAAASAPPAETEAAGVDYESGVIGADAGPADETAAAPVERAAAGETAEPVRRAGTEHAEGSAGTRADAGARSPDETIRGARPDVAAGGRAAAAPPGAPHGGDTLGSGVGGGRVSATPGARKLARELGIDLWYVAGSGPDGAVTVADVRGAVPVSEPAPREHTTEEVARIGQRADGSAREERTPISGIRKRTAAAMVASARTIPQASTSSTVDITASLELLDHLRATKTFEGLTPTPLALVAKSVLAALSEYPGINTYWDEANSEIVTRYFVNLGIAVATERGLLVPNIKDAQTLSLRELCREIGWLAQTARDGRAGLSELRGGTFTISNIGVFGVESGTPLVNPGEAAILCVGAVNSRPWVFRGELAVRSVVTLTLSFDHRMIDGELAARFLATVAGALEDPLTLLARI